MGFFPDTLFAFEGGGDDQLSVFRDVAVDAQSLEGPMVFDEGEGDHCVELGDEGLADGEVFGEGEIKENQLFAPLLIEIFDEVENTLLLKYFDRTVEPIFGDSEALFGCGVELVYCEVAGLIGSQNGKEGDLLFVKTALEKGLELCYTLMRRARHQGQGAEFEKTVEAAALGAAPLESQELFVVQRKELDSSEALQAQVAPGDNNDPLCQWDCIESAGLIVIQHQELDAILQNIRLYLCGREGRKGEIGVLAVDIEQRLLIHILQVVGYEGTFAGTPNAVEIDMVLIGEL